MLAKSLQPLFFFFKKVFIDSEHSFKDRSGDGAADRNTGFLKKVCITELEPSELDKGPHTMRYLAQVKNTPIAQPIADPSPEPGLGIGRVHTADGGALPAANDLDRAGDNPEGPLNSVGGNHFVCLTGIGGV